MLKSSGEASDFELEKQYYCTPTCVLMLKNTVSYINFRF